MQARSGRVMSRCACVFLLAFVAAGAAFAGDQVPPEKAVAITASAEPAPSIAPYAGPIENVQPTKVLAEKPSWRQVVDKKFVAVHAIAMGFTIADIERTQHCLGNGTCRELNPMLPLSRAGMYAVNVPMNAAAMYLSYRLKASGRRTWWIAPVAIGGSHGVGFGFKF